MKNITKYIVLAFLLLNINYIVSQVDSGIITYSKENYIPSIDTVGRDEEFKTKLRNLKNQLFKTSKQLEYQLVFNYKESLFELNKKLDFDGESTKMASTISGGSGTYYTNIKSKSRIHKDEMGGKTFLIYSDLDSLVWKLTNETKLIGKYICYKATTIKIVKSNKVYHKKVVAWYCPTLPYKFGPTDYCNLPGIILELSIEKGATFRATNVSLNKKSKIKEPKKGKKVTPEEFNEISKKVYLTLTRRN
jgi:GLPGLI family protein